MGSESLSILLLLGVLVLTIIGAPVAFSLASLGIVFGLIGIGPNVLPLFINRIYGLMNNVELPAIPLFIFMGFMLESCGIAEKLFDSLHGLLGRIRGGLALGTVIICTLFAACTGVIAASIVTMGVIALPNMLKRGYSKELATGSILVGGTLGVIIPPSIVLILYGSVSTLSVAKIFSAALIPGIILSLLYCSYIVVLCWLKPHHGPAMKTDEKTEMSLRKVIWDIWVYATPTLALIFLMMGAIIFGVVAITEAAALGAFGSILLAILFGKFSWVNFKKASLVTLKSTCMVLFVIIGASMMSVVLIRLGGAKMLANFVSSVPAFIPSAVSNWYVIGMMMIVLFIMGMFIDWIGILYIVIPAFTPVVMAMGFDPVWFAIIVNTNLQMAFCTPPFALSLFFLKGVAPPGVTMSDIYKGIWPFIAVQAVGLIIIIIFKDLSLWLPSLLF